MKRVILLLLLFLPIFVNAETCDYAKHNEYDTLSSQIKYETKLNKETNKYTVTLLNVYKDIYITYDSKMYNANSKHEIELKNISPGTTLKIKVASPSDNCSAFLRTITIRTNYYNWLYNNSKCNKYRDVLNICKYEYLSYSPDENMLDAAIKNYESAYYVYEKKEEVPQEKTFLENMKEFVMSWGIPVILLIITSAITITIYKLKFRKLKHGI